MISVVVQHHPSRAHLLPPLLEALGTDEVAVDPMPDERPVSAWRSYKVALETTPPEATHRVIVQDDAQPCADFRAKLEQRIAERPDRMIALYLASFPKRTGIAARKAYAEGERWIDYHPNDYVGTVGLVWPVDLIPRFLDFCEGRYKRFHGGDDGKVGDFVIENQITACATLPSLLQHPDVEPSVCRKEWRGRPRLALFFDWSAE